MSKLGSRGSTVPAAALILDLDGTLVDTAPDLLACIDGLLAEANRPPIPHQALRGTVSHGAKAMICHAFSISPEDPRANILESELVKRYRERIAEHSCLFPGMAEVLNQAEATGIPWGVVTNKPGELTNLLLERLGLSHRAGAIVSGDTLERAKPDPLPMLFAANALNKPINKCITIGDARRDIEAAACAGAQCLVAMFGYLDASDRPTHWGAHALIRHPQEILQWLNIALISAPGESPT